MAMSITRAEAIQLLPEPGLFIGGEWRTATTSELTIHIDPASGQATGPFLPAGPDAGEAAVAGARAGPARPGPLFRAGGPPHRQAGEPPCSVWPIASRRRRGNWARSWRSRWANRCEA